jgi:RND family efflux transporter MFP subunit
MNFITETNMKKTISLLAALMLAVSCQSEKKPESLAGKKELLAQKETALKELKAEIATLKSAIAELDTVEAEVEKLTPVQVLSVQPKAFSHYIKLSGLVSSEENVMLSAESNGRVVKVHAKEGQAVKAGAVLVELENARLRSQLAEAEAALRLAETTFKRRQRLWNDSIGSEIEFLNAETNYKASKNRLDQLRALYDNAFIKAPVSGTVDEISVNEGEFVGVGTPIVRVVDLQNLQVETEISEDYLLAINTGDTVSIEIPNLGLQERGVIEFTSQYINPDNRSFKVTVGMPKANRMIKPNLLAELKIRDYFNDSALVVPAIAIQRDLKGEYVYLAQRDGEVMLARKTYVDRGRSFGDQTEILAGIKSGSQVITAGFSEVNDGQAIVIQ